MECYRSPSRPPLQRGAPLFLDESGLEYLFEVWFAGSIPVVRSFRAWRSSLEAADRAIGAAGCRFGTERPFPAG